MANVFHVLLRDAKGKLVNPAKRQLRDASIKLDLTTGRTTGDPASVLSAFRKALPKSVAFPEKSPFVILRTPTHPTGPVAYCHCQCSRTSDCGGGGGGS